MEKRKVFVDMDGVIVDFDGYMTKHGLTGDEAKRQRGAYLDMEPLPGALEAVRSLIGMGFDVFIATKPPTGVSWAYADKAEWIFQHLPELKRKLIITSDKGLLGCADDFLIDDKPHKGNCGQFGGKVIKFGGAIGWPEVLVFLRQIKKGDEPTCQFIKAWIGKCGKADCKEHKNAKCISCGQPATHECAETHLLVCGCLLCDDCEHTIYSNGCNAPGYGHPISDLDKQLPQHIKKSDQKYKPWYMREEEEVK